MHIIKKNQCLTGCGNCATGACASLREVLEGLTGKGKRDRRRMVGLLAPNLVLIDEGDLGLLDLEVGTIWIDKRCC